MEKRISGHTGLLALIGSPVIQDHRRCTITALRSWD